MLCAFHRLNTKAHHINWFGATDASTYVVEEAIRPFRHIRGRIDEELLHHISAERIRMQRSVQARRKRRIERGDQGVDQLADDDDDDDDDYLKLNPIHCSNNTS